MPYKSKEVQKQKNAEYYQKNRASKIAYATQYRRDNAEAVNLKKQEWWEKNKNAINLKKIRNKRGSKILAVDYLGGKCVVCGLEDDPIVYDFHHRDPAAKEFEIAGILSCGTPKLTARDMAELDKCDLLCSHCHRKLHQDQCDSYYA